MDECPKSNIDLNQTFNINISVSCAYTYTDNAKSKTYQARRHHEGKNVNPGARLKKTIRDQVKQKSNKSHFATTDVRCTLVQVFKFQTATVARDDKARCPCDCEIVDRPSKSWTKISYSDHSFQKDTSRSIIITTYQFVKKKTVPEEDVLLSRMDGLPVLRSKVTGPALSLLKCDSLKKKMYSDISMIIRYLFTILQKTLL